MANTRLLLHTNALMDFYAGKGDHKSVARILKCIENGDFEGFISAFTVMQLAELLIHVDSRLCFKVIDSLHTTFGKNIIPISSRIAVESVQVKIKYGLESADAIICATARRKDALLLTTSRDLLQALSMTTDGIKATAPQDFARKAGLLLNKRN